MGREDAQLMTVVPLERGECGSGIIVVAQRSVSPLFGLGSSQLAAIRFTGSQ